MFFLLWAGLLRGDTLQGPNLNPANLPILVEWEKFTGQQAGVIGDNLSADSWAIFREAPTYREEGQKGAMAEQLRRWANAFDGNGIIEGGEEAPPYSGSPKGALSDYVVELAIPMFPNRMENREGTLVSAMTVDDRWAMGEPENRHHEEAADAFRALAVALVKSGMSEARLRLGWEFSGDWFPWGIDPEGGEAMGTAEQYKACWKFIYLTMEEVNPKFTWVWCSTVGYDHFDPSAAFPEYPDDSFLNASDQEDKILADFVSVDVYDADGAAYYLPDDPEGDDYELVPGYWNAHEEKRKAAYERFVEKIFEGRGHHAKGGESSIYGMRYFKELADEKGLPLVVSEWGPWANWVPTRNWNEESGKEKFLRSAAFGGDDNPLFIDGFFRWAEENEVGYSILFEFYNGGEGDTVDHTLLPRYWNTPQEGRPRVSLYPETSPYSRVTDQLHPQAAEAYLRNLKKN